MHYTIHLVMGLVIVYLVIKLIIKNLLISTLLLNMGRKIEAEELIESTEDNDIVKKALEISCKKLLMKKIKK